MKHLGQENVLVPMKQTQDQIPEMKTNRREFFMLGGKALMGALALALQGLHPRSSSANPLWWLGRAVLGPILRLVPRTIPRIFGRGATRGAIGRGAVEASRAIPSGQISILEKFLIVADVAMIASLAPELVYALENHRPKKNREEPPTLWKNDGPNGLEIEVINTLGRGVIDDLWLELSEYDSEEEPISTFKMGEVLIPMGKGNTFPLIHKQGNNKYVVNGLPKRVPIATMLTLRGFLPNHPDILVSTSGPILVADSGSVTYFSDIG